MKFCCCAEGIGGFGTKRWVTTHRLCKILAMPLFEKSHSDSSVLLRTEQRDHRPLNNYQNLCGGVGPHQQQYIISQSVGSKKAKEMVKTVQRLDPSRETRRPRLTLLLQWSSCTRIYKHEPLMRLQTVGALGAIPRARTYQEKSLKKVWTVRVRTFMICLQTCPLWPGTVSKSPSNATWTNHRKCNPPFFSKIAMAISLIFRVITCYHPEKWLITECYPEWEQWTSKKILFPWAKWV